MGQGWVVRRVIASVCVMTAAVGAFVGVAAGSGYEGPPAVIPPVTFTQVSSPAAGGQPFAGVSGDVNGDGRPDIVTANEVTDNVSVLLGSGGGTFAHAVGSPIYVGQGAVDVALGDIDGDGDLDIAVTMPDDDKVSLLLGDGTGSYSLAAGSPFVAGDGARSVALADLNSDGHLDLVVDGGSVTVLLGDGAAGFSEAASSPFAVDVGWGAIAVGDVNRDGLVDVVAADFGGIVRVLLGDGSSNLFSATVPSFNIGSAVSAVLVDLNNDGLLDVATANQLEDDVSVLLGNGTAGLFSPASTFAVGRHPTSIATGDVNGDGRGDLIVTNEYGDSMSVLLGTGTGSSFASVGPVLVGDGPQAVMTADVDSDGRLDLLVANLWSSDVTVLLAQRPVASTASYTPAPAIALTTPSVDQPLPTSSQFVASGDVNGDGDIDLVTANTTSSDVSVLLGDGSGNFTEPLEPFHVPSAPRSVALGDVDSDGDVDIVVAGGTGSKVFVFLGDGAGGFVPGFTPNHPAGSAPVSVALGDVDGDGYLDYVTANDGGDNVTVYLNVVGLFFYLPVPPTPVGSHPNSVALGDVNGDGLLDVVTANAAADTVSVLIGSGDGSLLEAAESPFAVGDRPISLAIADANADGDLDLITANQNSDDVSVLLGTGTGDFTAAPGSPVAVGDAPTSAVVGDMNSDGELDLITAGDGGSGVSVLVGAGTGTFSSPGLAFPSGDGPSTNTLADLNGDGRLDVATANHDSSNVSILLSSVTITPSVLPVATVGVAFSTQLAARGNRGAATFTVTSGSLPAGLSLSSAGVLSGVPIGLTSTPFTVTATDGTGFVGTPAVYTLHVDPDLPSAPTGVAGVGGDHTVALTWNAPDRDGGAPITGYRIGTSTAAVGCIVNTDTNSTDAAFTVPSLTNDTPYWFCVAAVNSVGTGPTTISGSSTTLTNPTNPARLFTALDPVRVFDTRPDQPQAACRSRSTSTAGPTS